MTSRGREQLVAMGEVELCVEHFGEDGDPPVLLLHGAAAPMDWWPASLCRALADGGLHVVRYDHRDTGRSTTGRPGHPDYDGTALTRDAVGLLETLGRPVHLVGLSMGGGIAQEIALRRPDLVATLTLVATTAVGGVPGDLPGPTPEVQRLFAEPPPPPDWSDADAVAESLVAAERAFAGPLFDQDDARATARTIVARSHDPAAADNHWLVLDDGSGAGEPLDARRITVPTLVVHGDADPLFPLPHGRALAEAVPGARLLVVERMGHEVPPSATWPQVVPALLAHLG